MTQIQPHMPEVPASRGPWLSQDDRALGLHECVHLIQRPRPRDVDKDEPAEVQDKPARVLGCDCQQATGERSSRGAVQLAGHGDGSYHAIRADLYRKR
jgi:hypothetical protein